MRPLVAVAALLLGACGPRAITPPPPDTCLDGQSSGVDTVAIGAAGAGPFVAWSDGDHVELATGGQGLRMLPMRILVAGSAPPACLAQSTRITDANGTGTADDAPLGTYADAAGRVTHDRYVILNGTSSPLMVTTTVGTATVTRTLSP